ncbi:circadian clock KaiB family protein [Allocoleopsis sp.]|uniref:circadian clock KaiB family protein n=1 Tax=Allocoleopsis sp. TaxID=3088169 RepID=UPI002FD10C64
MNNSVEGKESSSEISQSYKEEFEQSILKLEIENYVFRLYVAGNSPKSVRAIQNLNKICEKYIKGHYEIEVIDIYQRPELLEQEQIFAIPTLIKKLPPPLQRLIGDMTNIEEVVICLGL